MYNNERRFGAAPSMPDPSTKKPEDDSKVEKVSQEIAADVSKPVMEENIKAPETKTSEKQSEKPVSDVAAAMEEALKTPGPNIRPVEFKDTSTPKVETSDSGPIHVMNANGIVSGTKLVNSMWRPLCIALIVVIVLLAGGLVWAILKYDKSTVEYRELSATSKSASSNLAALYEQLGVDTQEEAVFAASVGGVLDGAAISSLNDTLASQFGEFAIDYTQVDFNSVQRVGGYKIVKIAINDKKYVAFAKDDNVWTVVEFVETLRDRCEGYSDEARLVVDKLLSCKEG